MSNQIVPQFDPQQILEAMMNPLGGLDLSKTESKLLFFRHLGAEYAQAAKRGRVPYANQLVKAGQSFGGLTGGMDPMMMLMYQQMFNQQQQQPTGIEGDKGFDLESTLMRICDRLEVLETKVGAGA